MQRNLRNQEVFPGDKLAVIEEFNKGEVTIAATTFLRYGNKAVVQMPPVPRGTFSIWVEEMKLPPLEEGSE